MFNNKIEKKTATGLVKVVQNGGDDIVVVGETLHK